MEQLTIIRPACREKRKEKRLTTIVEGSTAGLSREVINTIEEMEQVDLTNEGFSSQFRWGIGDQSGAVCYAQENPDFKGYVCRVRCGNHR